MNVLVTEYLRINLSSEKWECRRCDHELGSARENYKESLLVYARAADEVHKPVLDPKKYEYTFAPDKKFCSIYEFYCPQCGTMMEVEYQVPGHLPVHDIELDIDQLNVQWAGRDEVLEAQEYGSDELAGSRADVCNH